MKTDYIEPTKLKTEQQFVEDVFCRNLQSAYLQEEEVISFPSIRLYDRAMPLLMKYTLLSFISGSTNIVFFERWIAFK